MPRFGKPNATGRSSGKLTGRQGELRRPPDGESWAWLTRELVASPTWRLRSINCIRLIDFLLVEHMNHAARENGHLKAPYNQLVGWGLVRSEIRRAIEEAEFLGLIRYERGGRWAGTNQPSRFLLTFYADKEENPATNEWKGKTEEAIAVWKRDRALSNRARRQK